MPLDGGIEGLGWTWAGWGGVEWKSRELRAVGVVDAAMWTWEKASVRESGNSVTITYEKGGVILDLFLSPKHLGIH